MDSSSPEVQIKRIVLNRMRRCAVCHRPYETGDIHVLSRRDDMWMMVVECDDCHARNFVAAVLNDGDPNDARMALQRMSEDERDIFGGNFELMLEEGDDDSAISEAGLVADSGPITAGDVVDMHEFLLTFDGDFHKLFSDQA
jgi:hypothetical protein